MASRIQAPRWLTTSEVATILRVSPRAVQEWAAAGKLPAIRTPTGRYCCCPRCTRREQERWPDWDPATALLALANWLTGRPI